MSDGSDRKATTSRVLRLGSMARAGLGPFMPFWMRTLLASLALLAALDAPAGQPLQLPR
jgi:hypothetical protein